MLRWLQPAQLPRLDAIEVDLPVVAFAAIVAAAAALLAGLIPSIVATRTDAVLAMRAGARGTSSATARRMRSVLVIAEIAASIVLLVGAALLARSLAALIDTDLGVNTEGVMVAQMDLGLGRTLSSERQLLWEGTRLVVAGTILGVAGAYVASGVLSSFVYGVTTTDLSSFLAAAVALILVALLACYLPARRAALVDPAVALRSE